MIFKSISFAYCSQLVFVFFLLIFDSVYIVIIYIKKWLISETLIALIILLFITF